MGRLNRAIRLILCPLLLVPPVAAAKTVVTARLWLLQAPPNEGQTAQTDLRILPVSATPALAFLQAKADRPDDEFRAALIDALLEMDNLRSLTDLFYAEHIEYGSSGFSNSVELGRQVAYRINLSHKLLGSGNAELRIIIARTREGVLAPAKNDRAMLRNAYEASIDEDKMVVILDQQILVEFGNPIVMVFPYNSQAYYLALKLTLNEPEPRKRQPSPKLKSPQLSNLVQAPRPTQRVIPAYPDELRRRGIKGDVGLLLAIDGEGYVRRVQLSSPLHPYLDYVASQAVWDWRFEPVRKSGKPIPAAFALSFSFSPEAYAQGMKAIEEPSGLADIRTREDLGAVLSSCADYCRKLRASALFYTCEENINETTHALRSSDQLEELALGPRDRSYQVTESPDGQMQGWLVEAPHIMSARNIDRLRYSCDYQMIRRFGEIEERRIVLEENGHKITDRVKLLEEGRYASLLPITSVGLVLDEAQQPLFHYRIIKQERIAGRDALIIEALPRLGNADGILSAKAWLEKGSGRILRCEIEGVPIDGYDDILAEAVLLNIKPRFLRTHDFQMDYQGILLPTRTTVLVEYPSLVRDRYETKSKINLSYGDFRFFSVETTHEVIKK